jgi:hypothetical protein
MGLSGMRIILNKVAPPAALSSCGDAVDAQPVVVPVAAQPVV